jgi:hypothetical protein
MEKHINTKKNYKSMKRNISIFSFMFLLMFIMTSCVHAVSLSTNVDQYTYSNEQIASINQFVVYGGTNDNITFNPLNGSPVVTTYDFKQDIRNLQNPYYLIIPVYNANMSGNISLYPINNQDGSLLQGTTYNVQFSQNGTYYLKISPDYAGEGFLLYLDLPSTYNPQLIKIAQVQSSKVDNIFGSFISATQELMQINLGFWILLYYVAIGIVVISVLTGLISVVLMIFKLSSDLRNRQGFISSIFHKNQK